jgi:pimeloyl-ACP methyl ester carboxylesterase
MLSQERMNDNSEGLWSNSFWQSRDGLKLHYRDYPGSSDRPPVICLPGLTRNSRDFANLAARIAGEWRVICPEMRGRGESAYAKDAQTYVPEQYVEDLKDLLEQAGVDRFVVIGTSLGGIMTMLAAEQMPKRIAGAVINDVGPVLAPEGLRRIAAYVGQGRTFATWMHAARALEQGHRPAYPDFHIADWLAMAKRLMTLSSNGRIVFDYDMKIAEPFASIDPENQRGLWDGLDALAGRPLLFLRGALSDILSEPTFERMKQHLPGAEFLTIGNVGHAPTLDEADAVAGIDRVLAKV